MSLNMQNKSPEYISEYFRNLAKKRTDNNRGFSNVETAKLAAKKSAEVRKIKSENKKAEEQENNPAVN